MPTAAAEAYHYNNLTTATQRIITERCKHDCAYQFWFLSLLLLFFLSFAETSSLTVFLAAFLFGCSFLFLGTGSCSYSRLCSVADPGSSNSLEFAVSFRNLSSSVRPSEVSSRIVKVMKVTELSCSNLANFFPFCQQTSIQPRNAQFTYEKHTSH